MDSRWGEGIYLAPSGAGPILKSSAATIGADRLRVDTPRALATPGVRLVISEGSWNRGAGSRESFGEAAARKVSRPARESYHSVLFQMRSLRHRSAIFSGIWFIVGFSIENGFSVGGEDLPGAVGC